eukprot:Seg4674.2 transcript_id=Seg4674.2/GoldUCD/mRNA.D3Y31 product="hypothetical protein" protein_id=Seg4674.2/GoldUCD/D3Y31
MEKSRERKFRSARRSRKRPRNEQLASARASKRALLFDEPKEAIDEAMDNSTAVQVEEVCGESGGLGLLGLVNNNETVAKKSRSELKINMTTSQQPAECSESLSALQKKIVLL